MKIASLVIASVCALMVAGCQETTRGGYGYSRERTVIVDQYPRYDNRYERRREVRREVRREEYRDRRDDRRGAERRRDDRDDRDDRRERRQRERMSY